MRTVTLSEQIQVIMEKVPEPAILNVDFYEIYDTPAEVEAFADYGDDRREFGGENPNEGDDLVLPGFGCPACHERRPDFLIIGDDERVTCQSCGKVYGLPDGLYDEWDDDRQMVAADENWYDRYALAHPGALM